MNKILLPVVILILNGCRPKENKAAYNIGEINPNATTVKNTETKPDDTYSWQYYDREDKMEGKKTYFAEIISTNTLNFSFPYDGGSIAHLTLRHKNGDDILLSISKGQMLLNTLDLKKTRIKFDDEKPMTAYLQQTSSYDSDVAFLVPAKKIISKLKSAKRVVIEAEFYQSGVNQMEFNVEGLNWNH